MAALSGRGLQRGVATGRVSAEGAQLHVVGLIAHFFDDLRNKASIVNSTVLVPFIFIRKCPGQFFKAVMFRASKRSHRRFNIYPRDGATNLT